MDSGKSSAVCDAFVAKPKPELKSKLGTIVGIIELFAQPDEFVDKFFEIINDLETEYYLPPFETEGGIEKRFEECLQRANRRIHKAINDSVIELEPKNINSLVALIHHGKIYLSQIGQNNALLFHRKKQYDYIIVDIFSQAGDKTSKINSEKMFSNIINGAITEKDNLFFCNDSVLEYISQNELMEIITEESPASALKEIESILKKDSQDNNFYAIAIEPVIKEDKFTEQLIVSANNTMPEIEKPRVPSQTSINKLISTQENTEKYLAPSMAPNWKKALVITVWGLRVVTKFIIKYLKIISLEIIKLSKVTFNYIYHKFAKQKLNNRDTSTINSDQSLNPNKPTIDPSENTQTSYSHKLKENKNLFDTISDFINRQITKFVSLNKLQKSLFITGLVLIFFFSQSMVWQGQVVTNSEKTSTSDIIKQIEDNLNAGEAKNIFNDEAGSKESLQLAINLLSQIPNNNKYQATKNELQSRIDDLNRSLQKIVYLDNPETISDLFNQNESADLSSMTISGNYIFVFDNNNQNIYKIDLEKKQTIAKKLPQNFSNVRKIAAIDDNKVLLLNNDSELYTYNLETNLAESSLTNKDKITDISLYGGKLYALIADKGQILKHFPVDTGYNSGSSWIKDGTDITDIVTFTIDGGIYTINDTGNIKYLLSGKLMATNFSEVNPAISSPKQIFTDGDSSYLYVLDQNNQRIIVFEKNSGNIKTQYSSKEFSNMKSIIINSKEKKIYVLANKKIYLINTDN
ncbi:hypothetical protein GW933_02315 [Candidatus Falkowbacteria bacterium]|uniref:Uncharacterized protein n=1 Tax=Candidatus Buchananbacteria bacterium CG10_big_fil_rev_8_21_14_0_10_33_19 TaxID=1974525 RepID=A0A2H0W4A2_9BACT|nr:hypothetical protein [Candidatus Falkowbacteria bacterium]PIS06144.1 MAG: hypothetical protein COT80_01065 [Candidatus Buchananbacteria bacterium CG10_big_fil_rev_8_21_14_0_10_33_19]